MDEVRLGISSLENAMEYASPSPEQFDGMPFSDLIRTVNEHGLLLGDWSNWKRYREMRGKTSHTYDEAIALEVVASIPEFLQEAIALRDNLVDDLR